LGEQGRILRSFPEVASVFGSVGRSDSATDNAPLDMYDTTVMLKPRKLWPAGMTYGKLMQGMDAKLQFPGLSIGSELLQTAAGSRGPALLCFFITYLGVSY
jgi:Cu(I)/Ag(I) efflux system membrane protein CusA/SilA